MQGLYQFFIKFASYIIIISILVLHILGYLVTLTLHENYNLSVWSIVGIIDMLLGFQCGKLIENSHKRVLYDSLTGIGNRDLFYLKFPSSINELLPTSVLLLDLDNFKNINDTYGHNEGDRVLKEFANILSQNTRVNDTVVRWGGEEFVIILPKTGIKEAATFAERIRIIIEKSNFFINSNDSIVRITTSIGVAAGKTKDSANVVIGRADRALYKAKEKRNLVMAFEE